MYFGIKGFGIDISELSDQIDLSKANKHTGLKLKEDDDELYLIELAEAIVSESAFLNVIGERNPLAGIFVLLCAELPWQNQYCRNITEEDAVNELVNLFTPILKDGVNPSIIESHCSYIDTYGIYDEKECQYEQL